MSEQIIGGRTKEEARNILSKHGIKIKEKP